MIEVCMADEQNPDVFEVKAQLLDASANLRRRAFEVAVNQNVALRSRNQIRSQVFAPDVVQVSGDAKRPLRSSPVRPLLRRQAAAKGKRK